MNSVNLIVIGAGPGGYRAAEFAAKGGLTVAVFEPAHVGGTCLNEGCIPTKSFVRNAEVMRSLEESELYGLNGLSFEFDFARVVARKDEVVRSLRGGVETLLSQPGITLVREQASLVDDHTVSAGGETYTADSIILATGSCPKTLRLEQCEGRVLDSSDLLALDRLPRSLCIVGAGVIGMEFASIFNAFGVEVTVVEYLKECLPALDGDIAKRLRKSLERRGVSFCMQSAVKAIGNGTVTFERKGKPETVVADEVLMAVGRRPRTEGLGLEAAGIALTPQGAIPVDDDLRVMLADGRPSGSLFAIGDVNGRQMLAHAAEMQALHVVSRLLGKPGGGIRLDIMPAAIFTHPEAACVGLSEDQCREQGLTYTCRKAFWRANGKALAMNEPDGMLKLLVGSDGRIVGCHAYGAHAADLVQEAAALMCRDTTVSQLASIVHIHPTLSEILRTAAED